MPLVGEVYAQGTELFLRKGAKKVQFFAVSGDFLEEFCVCHCEEGVLPDEAIPTPIQDRPGMNPRSHSQTPSGAEGNSNQEQIHPRFGPLPS